MEEIGRGVQPANIDAAAQYLKKLQNDAIWERMNESRRDRYRKQVEEVLRLCGITMPGASG